MGLRRGSMLGSRCLEALPAVRAYLCTQLVTILCRRRSRNPHAERTPHESAPHGEVSRADNAKHGGGLTNLTPQPVDFLIAKLSPVASVPQFCMAPLLPFEFFVIRPQR